MELIREAQAHSPEEEQVLDILLDELVRLGNKGLWHVDHVLRLKLKRCVRAITIKCGF
jgi:hypothetical protein